MASAVSDGGGSLEATHQGDTIAPVFCTLVFVWKSVFASAWEKKSDVIIYVFAATYTLRSEPRSSIFPAARMHAHVRLSGEVKQRSSAPLFRVLDMKPGVKNTLNNK